MSGNRWKLTLEERFCAKVQPAPALDCWLWTASLNDGGYGQMYVDGMPRRAHRIAYELLIGPIPDGLQLDHLCRVRRCVNPWHLEPVTNAVNMARGQFRATRPPAKTHCRHGHPFDETNTRMDPAGWRRCRACERVVHARRKAAA